MKKLLVYAVATLLLGAGPAMALDSCFVGQRVLSVTDRPATVVGTDGAGCEIHLDGDPRAVTSTWSAFMLSAAHGGDSTTAPQEQYGLPPGEYICVDTSGTLIGLGLVLRPDGTYADRDSTVTGAYQIADERITFSGGHFAGVTGNDVRGSRFTIDRSVTCQLW